MKQATIVIAVLAILIVLSGVQAVQLTGLKTQLSDAELNIGSQSSSRVQLTTGHDGGSGSSLPASIQDLPTMVGGC